MKRVLEFIRSLVGPGDTEYGTGWNDALAEVEEWALDQAWKDGEDVE